MLIKFRGRSTSWRATLTPLTSIEHKDRNCSFRSTGRKVSTTCVPRFCRQLRSLGSIPASEREVKMFPGPYRHPGVKPLYRVVQEDCFRGQNLKQEYHMGCRTCLLQRQHMMWLHHSVSTRTRGIGYPSHSHLGALPSGCYRVSLREYWGSLSSAKLCACVHPDVGAEKKQTTLK